MYISTPPPKKNPNLFQSHTSLSVTLYLEWLSILVWDELVLTKKKKLGCWGLSNLLIRHTWLKVVSYIYIYISRVGWTIKTMKIILIHTKDSSSEIMMMMIIIIGDSLILNGLKIRWNFIYFFLYIIPNIVSNCLNKFFYFSLLS